MSQRSKQENVIVSKNTNRRKSEGFPNKTRRIPDVSLCHSSFTSVSHSVIGFAELKVRGKDITHTNYCSSLKTKFAPPNHGVAKPFIQFLRLTLQRRMKDGNFQKVILNLVKAYFLEHCKGINFDTNIFSL